MPAKKELVSRLGAKSLLTVDEAFLDQLVDLILKQGCRYNNQIFPLLGVSESTWVSTKRNYPVIQQTLDYAWALHAQKVNGFFDKALNNPKNKNHWDAVKIEKKEISQRTQETTINHNVRVINPALEMSEDEIYSSLIDITPKENTLLPDNRQLENAGFTGQVIDAELLEVDIDGEIPFQIEVVKEQPVLAKCTICGAQSVDVDHWLIVTGKNIQHCPDCKPAALLVESDGNQQQTVLESDGSIG